MLINVRFIKFTKWVYKIGNYVSYKEGDEISVDESHGYEMIRAGYAVLVEDNLNQPEYGEADSIITAKKPKKSRETKVLDEPQEDKEVKNNDK